MISATATSAISPAHLTKLRLVVARFGEMDGAAWWNTTGMLGTYGKMSIGRGFPTTHYFAQARIAFAVASARCTAVFNPPGCFTLWNLPPEIEEAVDGTWQTWCRKPEEWYHFFADLAERPHGDLMTHLVELKLIDEETVRTVSGLKRSSEGKSVLLPKIGVPDTAGIMLLAAAFSRGEKGQLAVPYIRAE